MSIVNIIEHHENIYNIIEPPKSHYEIPESYISQWHKQVKRMPRRRMKNTKVSPPSLGIALYPPPDPNKFLKRGEGMSRWKPATPIACHPRKEPGKVDHKRESLPKHSKGCDFIRANALQSIRHRRRIPPMRVIDTPRGHRMNLLGTQYIRKPEYGKTPNYVEKRINEMKNKIKLKSEDELNNSLDLNDTFQINELNNSMDLNNSFQINDTCLFIKPRYITAPEREEILAGLKENWSKTQKEFLLLPMHTDTPPKIKRKLMIEKKLEALERDIRKIEENEYIYVLDNEKQPILE